MTPTAPGASEGDVETQVVMPLLTSVDLLALSLEEIRSKEGISARDIGKGDKRKIGYVPDFCVFKKSLPVAIVEAKAASGDVARAYGEARLYALEINRSFPHNCNPCGRIVATNGIQIMAGHWDAEPDLNTMVVNLSQGTAEMDVLLSLVGTDVLGKLAQKASETLAKSRFARPFNKGVGVTQIDSHIEPNTFAADLSPALRRYFSSRDQTTDDEIYSRAYISSNEVTSYDRILESYLKDRLSRSKQRTEITTSRRKSEEITKSISQFGDRKPLGGELLLVTGGVGAGKSLFARRYKEYLQPRR